MELNEFMKLSKSKQIREIPNLSREEQDLVYIAQNVEAIMNVLGIEMNESTEGTPLRVAKMFKNELFSSLQGTEELDKKMKLFDAPTGDSEMVIVKDIPFYSTCEHHFMPFFGKVAVGYVPKDKIVGLSKIPRVVKHFSKKPQVQERLGEERKEEEKEGKETLVYKIVKSAIMLKSFLQRFEFTYSIHFWRGYTTNINRLGIQSSCKSYQK